MTPQQSDTNEVTGDVDYQGQAKPGEFIYLKTLVKLLLTVVALTTLLS
jgi:hypothetical protein